MKAGWKYGPRLWNFGARRRRGAAKARLWTAEPLDCQLRFFSVLTSKSMLLIFEDVHLDIPIFPIFSDSRTIEALTLDNVDV